MSTTVVAGAFDTISLDAVGARDGGDPEFDRADDGLLGAEIRRVDISSISTSNSVRLSGENREHVLALAELSDPVPPILIHRPTMRVIDGMHRLRAAKMRGEHTIPACFFDGTDDDAFVVAVRFNRRHGLPLTRLDRRSAARRIIVSHPWYSDRLISSICGVSTRTVAGVRRDEGGAAQEAVMRIGADGRLRTLDVTSAREAAYRIFVDHPDATVREVARRAGVSVGTAQNVRSRLRDAAAASHAPAPRVMSPAGGKGVADDQRPVAADATDTCAPQVPSLPAFESLRRDPALRASSAGRTMLRLFAPAGLVKKVNRRRILESVPEHCVTLVAAAARECASIWSGFADDVENIRNVHPIEMP